MPTDVSTLHEDKLRLDDLLAKVSARDRANIEKHLAACEADQNKGHASLWKRLVVLLWHRAPMPVTMVGAQAMQFFIADGKFRMQVFALEDRSDGKIHVFMPDILEQAVKSRDVVKSGTDYFFGAGDDKAAIVVQQLDAANTFDPPAHVKHMIGWNRKAMQITLDVGRDAVPQLAAVEALSALASKTWAKKAG